MSDAADLHPLQPDSDVDRSRAVAEPHRRVPDDSRPEIVDAADLDEVANDDRGGGTYSPPMLVEEDGEGLLERAGDVDRAPEPGEDDLGVIRDPQAAHLPRRPDVNDEDDSADWSRTRVD